MLLKKRKTTNKGFLLIELLVSFAIITFVILSLTIAVLGMIFTKKQFITQESAKDISKQIVGSIMKREDNIDKLITMVCPTSTDCTTNKFKKSPPKKFGLLVPIKRNTSYTSQDQKIMDLIDLIEFNKIQDRIKTELPPNTAVQIYLASDTGNLPGTKPIPGNLHINTAGIPETPTSRLAPPDARNGGTLGYVNNSNSNTITDTTDISDRRFYITAIINYKLKDKSGTGLINENNNENSNPSNLSQMRQIITTRLMISQMAEIDQTLCDPMNPTVGNDCPICKRKPKYLNCEACKPIQTLASPLPTLIPSAAVISDYCPQCYDYRATAVNHMPPGGSPKYCRSCYEVLLDLTQVIPDTCEQCQGSSGLSAKCSKCIVAAQSGGTIPKPAGCP